MSDTTTETFTTGEALIKDLVAIYTDDNDAEHALAKAKDKHASKSDASMRALSQRLSAINEPLDSAQINTIAEAVATKLAKGNKNVLKSRKSEMKLCLDQRHNLATTLSRIDTEAANRKDDDDLRSINIRAAVLGSLRVTKKDGCTADEAVDQWLAKHDHVDTTEEKTQKVLDNLAANDLFKTDIDGEKELHPGAAYALDVLSGAISGDMAGLDELRGIIQPAEPTEPETDALDVLEGVSMPDEPGAGGLSTESTDTTEIDEVEPEAECYEEGITISDAPEPEPMLELTDDDKEMADALSQLTNGLL